MKVWSAIFNIFAALILVMLSFAYFNFTKVIQRDFDQDRLNQAVEYATEATFSSTLQVEDVGIDYTNLNVVSINPGDSLNTFDTMMCFNYDLAVSEENKRYIENSIAVAILSGDDGFYITQLAQDDTTPGNSVKGQEYLLKWSSKIPYLLTVGNKTFALNIGKESWVSVSDTGTIEVPTSIGYPSGITSDKALGIANAEMTDYMVQEIENKNANKDPFDYKFFLPVETTKAGVNPIKGPGILILMQGADFASTEKINAMSVSGYRVTTRVNVVAFTENVGGTIRNYYCYEGQMDPADIGSKYIVKNYYRDTKSAAKAGYAPQYGLLTKKITKR